MMNKEQYDYVTEVYNEIVVKQILDTHKLRKAANIILGRDETELLAVNRARQIIYSFWNYQREAFLASFEDFLNEKEEDPTKVDKTEINASKEASVHVDIPSHEEDFTLIVKSEVETLEEEYDKATTANEKRSLRMRINKLKKDEQK